MVAANRVPVEEPISGGHFQFITVQVPDCQKDPKVRRLARSHAVKQALEKKRRIQRDAKNNFRVISFDDQPQRFVRKRSRRTSISTSLAPLAFSASVLDPFQTLAVDSARLQALLGNYKARKAPEPVFSIARELAFQNVGSVFPTGLADPALLNAVMLSLVFDVAEGSFNKECLGYQGQALSHIRARINVQKEATSESTIGAILLLAGVEARLGMTSEVQLHMDAVQMLLDICKRGDIRLTTGIKRAIFWQDLNASILAGSRRIFSHETFPELQWTRASYPPSFFRLPSGFKALSNSLSTDFVEVLKDIHALKRVREVRSFTPDDVTQMAYINNQTASIQSRLSNVSTQLLGELQRSHHDSIWDKHPKLLLWLLYIGGAFAPPGAVRSSYIALLRLNNGVRFGEWHMSWEETLEVMKEFIWCEEALRTHVKALWEDAVDGLV